MKIELTVKKEFDAKFIRVSANVRYWGDAEINGDSSESGDQVPFKNGGLWCPVIDIDHGSVVGWPSGTVAKFHFKVCDAGCYQLCDESMRVLSSIDGGYVPHGLCHGNVGGYYGDYIIFNVGADGKIENYKTLVDPDDWCDEDD